jgi:hypothetical protein
VCGNERTRVSTLIYILLGARGIEKNKMKSTGRRPTTTTTRATSNVKNCVAFRPTQVHRAEKIGNHRSPRCWTGLCNCVHVPLYSTSPPIIIGGPFSFLKDSSATVSKEYWREGKTNGKLPSGVGLAPGTWATLRPIFFFEGWGGGTLYVLGLCVDRWWWYKRPRWVHYTLVVLFFGYSPTDWVQRRWGRMGGRRQGPIVCVTSFVVIIGLEILKRWIEPHR